MRLSIDEIHYQPPKPSVTDIIGGAGSYSALGARLFSAPPSSRSVGWVVDAGSDFSDVIRAIIHQWETSCHIRETPKRLTTRGWNGYGDDERRAFRYLTPKLRLDHAALTPALLLSKSFHLISSPTRCVDLVTNILALREQLDPITPPPLPLFIWEPVPDLCIPEELSNCIAALRHVDVVSPNHAELGGFFGHSSTDPNTGEVNHRLVEKICDAWMQRGIGRNNNGAVVVRAGRMGCYLRMPDKSAWLPAYHQPHHNGESSKVVDPTGGGNGFLGGFAVGLVRGGAVPGLQNLETAAIWGSVAASFAIEQVGMPILVQDAGREMWNGTQVQERLHEYEKRVEKYVQP
ncbi:MAG: hypothetical protein M1812_004045 [Candelaria pacifica]|nr:MAG: hypothetical protein M1812_004045 [Candelaria pacifica]